jgi:hypothetical protein
MYKNITLPGFLTDPSLLKFLKNKYFLVTLVAFFKTFVFDNSNLVTQIKLSAVINDLEEKRVTYLVKMEELEIAKKELDTWKEAIARERFFMHRKNEDVFIIEK